ncbi:MAG: hypothetical protein ACYTG0_09650 [Planctomycetota bacterium]|jgi:hypothetical protein
MLSTVDREGANRAGRLAWVLYAILFTVAVPWYWPPGEPTLWLGVPAWLVTSIAASAGISILTAALMLRRWPGEDEPAEESARGGGDEP